MKKLLVLSTLLVIFTLITLFATRNNLFENSSRHTEPKSKQIKEVKTEIGFLSGTLNLVAQDLSKVYSGEYKYPKEEFKPDISYTEEDKTGYLKIIATDNSDEKKFDSNGKNKWNIKLNNKIKNNLYIKMDAGEGKFNLANSMINRFDFRMAAGDIDIDLRNTPLHELNVKAIAGKVNINLTGKWNNDLHASVTGGAGELLLIIPETTGTEVEITGLLANIYAPEFRKDGHTYTNALFGKTNNNLHIEIFGGIGDVELRME